MIKERRGEPFQRGSPRSSQVYYTSVLEGNKYMPRRTKRNSTKIKKILKKRGYKEGKAPKGKEVHHIKSVAKGGKDTPKNIRVMPKGKHRRIHRARRKTGKI